jgi:hypothetical protein
MSRRTYRWGALAAALVFVALGLGIRAFATGDVAQNGGTALYASLIYAGVVFLRPGIRPWVAGVVAVLFCWLIELFQLTGVPAGLSGRSVLARLVLGSSFDPVDLVFYVVGVLPPVLLHAVASSPHDGMAGRGGGGAGVRRPGARPLRRAQAQDPGDRTG